MPIDVQGLRSTHAPEGLPFEIRKIGHVVLRAADLRRSVDFYTKVLGFRVSDVYGEDMMPEGMVFMRCNADHHGIALVGGMPGPADKSELHHLAFEVDTLDEVFRARRHLREHKVPIVFEGRRRAGVQIAVEFLDPDGHHLEIYWGLDRVGPDGRVRPREEWREAHSLEEAVANPVKGQKPVLREPSLMEKT
ncbi:MAG: hypothetical protein A3G83_06770 [Betaproteobacteria bacterium RIFCSPLOWO2_12_FULL_68_20]|nr:MAG: hypothetical protein A3G83_06770 [Betaproteobacteria bacterium RIFCSPLOWO2_12_FULL_68_20]